MKRFLNIFLLTILLIFGFTALKAADIQIDSVYNYQWDIVNQKWETSSKDLFYYKNGRKISAENYVLNVQFKSWMKADRNDYSYNSSDSIVAEIGYYWDEEKETWMKKSRTLYTYDNENRLIETMVYKWNTSSENWLFYISYSFDYEKNNIWKEMNIKSWDVSSQSWIYYYKHSRTFLENGLPGINIIQDWDNSTKEWKNYKKKEYVYSTDKNKEQEYEYDWNKNAHDWTCYRYFRLTYNLSGKITEEKTSFCFYDNRNSVMNKYDYDSLGNLITYYELNWNNTAGEWMNTIRKVMFYSQVPTSSDNKSEAPLLLYPNPTRDAFTIVSKENMNPEQRKIKIFNLIGESQVSLNYTDISDKEMIVDMHDFPSGIYILIFNGQRYLISKY